MSNSTLKLQRIADQLTRSVEGRAWHGPAVREVLDGVSAERAAARPLPACHTAWEILAHMTAWTRAVRRALGGSPLIVAEKENFPKVETPSDAAWQTVQSDFLKESARLLRDLGGRDDSLLTALVPGREYDFYYLLHGLVQHNLYHAGQIRLLTK